MRHEPPRLLKGLLRWFVNAEFVEEIEGDLDELYHEHAESNSIIQAKLLYLWDVVRAIRPYQARRYKSEVGHEIFNWIFLRLAYRNLMKRKAYSSIKILGLSIGLVSFVLIMEYVAFERSYDSFHENADRIYRVAFNWGEIDYQGENSSIYASSVPAMGPALLQEISEIESITRFVPVRTVKSYCVISHYSGSQISYTGNDERGFYADSMFLKILSFPIIKGDPSPLNKPNSIVLTKTFARKMFKNVSFDKIIGETIEVDADRKKGHIVTAILEDNPANSHIKFDYLISYATINSDRLEGNLGWSQFYTYVLATEAGLSNDEMAPKFKKLLNKLYGIDSQISIFLQPIEDIYLTSRLREELGENGSALQLKFLTIIAYIILIMAWINYVSMFLARSMERINEICVKKVLGSTRTHLAVQFFVESLVITCASLIVGILLLLLVQQPFEGWLGRELWHVFRQENEFVFVILLTVVIGSVIAGLYPALKVASYRPAQVLGAKLQNPVESMFKRGLVHFQFIVAFVIVSSTLIIDRQIGFMKNADLGMELSGRIAIRSPGDRDSAYVARLTSYKERLLRQPFIQNVSFTSSIPGRTITTSGGVQRVIGPELDGNNIFSMEVDENFLDTYRIRLIAGRNFSAKSASIPTVILNEAALNTLRFESPEEALNHRIHWQRKEYEVIGVFANYNHLFLKQAFEPIMLSFNPAPAGFITLKVKDGYHEQALAISKVEMQNLFPSNPFEYNWIETTYDYQYNTVQQFETLTRYFAVLAILIACLGLFALSYYSVQRRIKEMAVRKVFGASIADVLILLSKSYIRIVLVSGSIGTCLTFFIMKEWLQNFAFAISLGFMDFFVSVTGITCIVLISVIHNCFRTSLVNPSHILKQS